MRWGKHNHTHIIKGTKADDMLIGTELPDLMLGKRGNDTLDGGAGSDFVFGGKGNDLLTYVYGENQHAKDVYFGGQGYDTLQMTFTQTELEMLAAQNGLADWQMMVEAISNRFDSACRDAVSFCSLGIELKIKNIEKLDIYIIQDQNQAPLALDDQFATDQNTILTIPAMGVLVNDNDPDNNPLQAVLVDGILPSAGVLTLNPDGSFVFDPQDNYINLPAGQSQVINFTYQASDGSLESNIATVKITINGLNDAPIAEDDTLSAISEGGSITFPASDLLANDSDPDNDPLSIATISVDPFPSANSGLININDGSLTALDLSAIDLGILGMLNLGAKIIDNSDGTFSYEAGYKFVGLIDGEAANELFNYQVSDGDILSNFGMVSLAVNGSGVDITSNQDVIIGSENEDFLVGGINLITQLTIIGNDGDDVLKGASSSNMSTVIEGGGGGDLVIGGDLISQNQISGNDGDDVLISGNTVKNGNILMGGEGNDTLLGADYLFAADQLYPGPGNDVLKGGDGQDFFVFLPNEVGTNIIIDFQQGFDQINLSDFNVDFVSLNPTEIDINGDLINESSQIVLGSTIIDIANVLPSDLLPGDFIGLS